MILRIGTQRLKFRGSVDETSTCTIVPLSWWSRDHCQLEYDMTRLIAGSPPAGHRKIALGPAHHKLLQLHETGHASALLCLSLHSQCAWVTFTFFAGRKSSWVQTDLKEVEMVCQRFFAPEPAVSPTAGPSYGDSCGRSSGQSTRYRQIPLTTTHGRKNFARVKGFSIIGNRKFRSRRGLPVLGKHGNLNGRDWARWVR